MQSQTAPHQFTVSTTSPPPHSEADVAWELNDILSAVHNGKTTYLALERKKRKKNRSGRSMVLVGVGAGLCGFVWGWVG
jgi:hypothetical protein